MRCTESEDSSDLNSEKLFRQQLVFISSLRVFFLFVFDVLHTVINSVYVQTLPTEQATPALTDFFSRGHDPFAHACEARPLTIVGWTFLNVIVIVTVNLRYTHWPCLLERTDHNRITRCFLMLSASWSCSMCAVAKLGDRWAPARRLPAGDL